MMGKPGMKLVLSVVSVAVIAVSADFDCSVVPPALWCVNDTLAMKCGFKEMCDNYNKETKNKRVSLTLFYEALCGGCQNFVTNILYPVVYKQFGDYVDIELVPFGNARIKNHTVICQHGEEECLINKFESCVIDSIKGTNAPLPYIYCLEKQLQAAVEFHTAIRKCYNILRIPQKIQANIKSCMSSGLGERLQLAAAKRTYVVFPEQHDHVPWMLFNNVSLRKAQPYLDALPTAICEWYTGDPMPPACESNLWQRMRFC